MKKISSKIIALILIFVFSLSPIVAIRADAQWVVWDPGNFVPNVSGQIKDYGLDSVAWIIVNLVIERMAASTVNWINGGFKGSPAFITDPSKYYSDLGNKIAGQYIFSNPNLNFLCGPISARVRLALAQNYINDNRVWQCKLTDAYGNMQDFLNDFDNGGWDKFFTMSQNPTQNPIGAYVIAQSELSAQISTRQGQKKEELSWGSGFLSYKSCARWETVAQPSGLGTIVGDTVDPITGIPQDTLPADTRSSLERSLMVDTPDGPLALGDGNGQKCAEERTNTPGSVIQTKLNDVLNVGNDKLAVADEINEIVSALLTQLVNHVVGGIGKGLSGLSRPDSTNNNDSFTSQLTNRNPGDPIEGYFGEKPNTTILDTPLDPSSVGIDESKLVTPSSTAGANPGTGGGILPSDPDCARLTYDEITKLANQDVASGLRATFEEAVLQLDCPAN